VADFCTKALVMYAGQVVERGPAEEMFYRPAHPYTTRLLSATPHGARRGEDLVTIEGMVPPPGRWPVGCHFAPRCPRAEEACGRGPIPLSSPAAGRDSRCLFAVQEMALPR
jgi:peptide/nickel transport system permease protein